jgi:hypothetical protein
LGNLGRPPSQEELDTTLTPLLDALEMMHGTSFLHRDIAPDNIIIREDGTPVLLDFGAARRAVGEMSRTLTGIVKAGYSPQEQYSTDGRLQGPWTDIYALGATLYRAVTGKPPEEAALRVNEDHMPAASTAAKGQFRSDFLDAIDSCLKVRYSERPQSIAQLRPMLLGRPSKTKLADRSVGPTHQLNAGTSPTQPQPSRARRRWGAAAAMVAIFAGAYGGYEYQRRHALESRSAAEIKTAAGNAEAQRRMGEAVQRQIAMEAERIQKDREAAEARRRQTEIEEQRRKEAAERNAEEERKRVVEAEAQRKGEVERRAAEEEAQRKAEAERRAAEAEAQRKAETERRAAEEEAQRKAEAERRAAEAEAQRNVEEKLKRAAAAEAQRKAEEERKRAVEARRKAELSKTSSDCEQRSLNHSTCSETLVTCPNRGSASACRAAYAECVRTGRWIYRKSNGECIDWGSRQRQ